MIERIRIIGVGLGGPGQVTGEAARALATVDVLLLVDPGDVLPDLVAARQAVCDALIPADHAYRVVEVTDPQHVDTYAHVIDGLAEGETTVGVLVWGDPAYDESTIRVVDALVERYAADGVAVDHDVIAGISAPQLLAARHRIPLVRIDVPLHITTGRHLVDEYDPSLGDVVVLRDGHLACTELADAFPDLELYWGAYLGAPDELLVHGRLADVIDEVGRMRAAARARHGWVADTYLLRQPADAPGASSPPSFPETDALTDGVVTLRPVTAGDWEVVRDEHNDEESLRWDFDGQRLTDDDARRSAARAALEWRRGRAARFVMVDVASGEGAGVIGVLRMGPPGTGLVGYGVLPAFRGRGYTTRALRLVSRWAFEEADPRAARARAQGRQRRIRQGSRQGRLPDGGVGSALGCPTPTAPGRTRSTTPWSPDERPD